MVELSIGIPQDFLNEEVRCDYTVSSQTKEIWAIELDLLHQLDTVCKANNLKYFAGAGTLLGAIRHKGFIPWDDDIDIYMLRDDYDKLLGLANEFKEPYFLHNAYTDQDYMRTFTRLRNTHTSFVIEWDVKRGVNKRMGIFIDIFPLDGICDNKKKDRIQKTICRCYRVLFDTPMIYDPKWGIKAKIHETVKRMASHAFRKHRLGFFRKYETQLKKHSVEGIKMWGNRTIDFDCPRSRRPIEDWMDIIETPFEFTSIPIPRNYDAILRQQYGDYMVFPKDKNSGKLHQVIEISTDCTPDDVSSRVPQPKSVG